MALAQSDHALMEGMRRWRRGNDLHLAEAEHWRAALAARVLLITGLRPGEFCGLQAGFGVRGMGASEWVNEIALRFPRLKKRGGRGQHASHGGENYFEIAAVDDTLMEALGFYVGVAAPLRICAGSSLEEVEIKLEKIRKRSPCSVGRNDMWSKLKDQMKQLHKILVKRSEKRLNEGVVAADALEEEEAVGGERESEEEEGDEWRLKRANHRGRMRSARMSNGEALAVEEEGEALIGGEGELIGHHIFSLALGRLK